MKSDHNIVSAAISDRGLSEKRPQNEDSFLEMNQCGIFAVADGVGGAQAGEVASQMAVELLGEAFTNLPSGSDAESVMRAAFTQANSAIHQMAQELPQLASMATTIVALHLAGDIATIGHVGDSRLYRVDEDGNLFRETDDHSMIAEGIRAGRMTEEQAENHPSRNIISRALGAEAAVEPDLKTIMFDPGATFLLCSDGITRHVTDAEIKGVLTFGRDPVDICEYLKGLCFERGAEDNLTAVVVRVGKAGAAVPARTRMEPDSDDLLDVEECTIATARTPFEENVLDEEDELLELETAELRVSGSETDTGIPDEPFDDTIRILEPQDSTGSVPTVDEPMIVESPTVREAASISDAEMERPRPDDSFSMFGENESFERENHGSASYSSILTAVGFLVLGAAIGLGVYHFTFAPNTKEMQLPQLSEMRSANIPLSAFEENRRNVDKDPAGYISKFAADPQDCEDYYLLGRAYVLTADFTKAKAALSEARNRLPGADPVNAKTLSVDIAVTLAVVNDTTVQTMLKKELDSVSSSATNSNTGR